MSTLLIRHLKNCAETDTTLEPLFAQWSFDEKLAEKALQNVAGWFPHYSRHDASHARQILIHIERLLGEENIFKLSATDTWLILECAYFHDIGMVVPFDHALKDFDSTEFHEHLKKMRARSYADEIRMIDALLSNNGQDSLTAILELGFAPLYGMQLVREILADFYRSKHPERSETFVSRPTEIGMNSPRTELIPARLFTVLGKICSHHGKSFSDVMRLPYRQLGMGRDDCHPRYIACLLRLGDLLDLDDNRFCPVMLRTAGILPENSKAHIDKHSAIRYFRADRDRIEIEAECQTYEGYIATNQWFTWLREEIQQQMGCWFDIVPSRGFGLLPSVGDLKVQLKDWKRFNDSERPHFGIDGEKIFEIMQGAGIYEYKLQAIRELLQNAVDATLIRAWLEHGENMENSVINPIRINDKPREDHIQKILANYSITIKIEKHKEDEKFIYWRVCICDQGIGISEEDFHFMMQIAGSGKNEKRKAIIETMPIWMRPSGIFGIGFHSVFMLTDEVEIETRSITTGDSLFIKLTNPMGNEKGNIYVKNGRKWAINHYGSEVSFVYRSSKKNFSYKYGDNRVTRALQNYDYFQNEAIDFNFLAIIDEIESFFNNACLIKGRIHISEHSLLDEYEFTNEHKIEWHYFPAQSLELRGICISNGYIAVAYRGQLIKDFLHSFKFISLVVNLLNDQADKILTISRNKLRDEAKENIQDRICRAVKKFFRHSCGRDLYDSLTLPQKALLAAEYELRDWTAPDYFNVSWNETGFSFTENGKKVHMPISEIQKFDEIIIIKDNYVGHDRKPENSTKSQSEKNGFQINLDDVREISPLVFKYLKNKNYFPEYHGNIENENKAGHKQSIVLNKHPKSPISETQLRAYCKSLISCNQKNDISWLKRQTIPCLTEYNLLALKDTRNWDNAFSLDLVSPRMLFPVANINNRITVGNLDRLCDFVYKNRQDKSVKIQTIQEAYKKFISQIDELMSNEPDWIKLRGSEFEVY